MATLEDENKHLREKIEWSQTNNEIIQKTQYFKMLVAQKEDEKLALMKENNEIRLKYSRFRNNVEFHLRKLDAALQEASEKAISHLVQASAEIAKSMEFVKQCMRESREMDASPRWSAISDTQSSGKKEKVHRVPPMVGGQSIQPVVALSRTLLNTSNTRSTTSSPNRSNITQRAVPMHMLQDVYIPLTRIDIPTANMDVDAIMEDNADDSTDGLLEGEEEIRESDGHISEEDEFETSRLEPVSEEDSSINVRDIEPARLRLQSDRQSEGRKDKQMSTSRGSSHIEDPLEGPSWLLDDTPSSGTPVNNKGASSSGRNLEPDSTTEVEKTPASSRNEVNTESTDSSPVVAFSPTVRRRKRTSSPVPLTPVQRQRYSPRPNSARRNSTSGRVLKVLVAKMRLEGGTPAKRARSPPPFNAPSPKGATDSRVIVSESGSLNKETLEQAQTGSRRDSHSSTAVSERGRHSREYEDVRRVASEHERRTQDGRESHHRLPSQDGDSARSRRHSRDSNSRQRDNSRQRSCDNDGHQRNCDNDSHQRSCENDSRQRNRDSDSSGAGDSISEGRTRRTRKPVTYKEKPLNRKLRR
nr:protein IWS1 homolog [Helicoverpa armigera]